MLYARPAAISPLFGIKIRQTFDPRPAQGYTDRELRHVYADLIADSHEAGLILESAAFEEVDGFYNPGEDEVDPDFILEAIVIDKFSRADRRMKAVCRVFRRMLEGEEIKILDPVVGKPKKSGGFAYVTVQLPFSDGQVVSVIFHSPEGDKKRIGPEDMIIAFRWLLNKRDITQLVSPEDGREVALEKIAKRVCQLVVKNSARFEATQKEAMAEKRELDELSAKIEEAEERQNELSGSGADAEKELASMDAEISNLMASNQKLRTDIAELEAKLAAMREAGQKSAAPDSQDARDADAEFPESSNSRGRCQSGNGMARFLHFRWA